MVDGLRRGCTEACHDVPARTLGPRTLITLRAVLNARSDRSGGRRFADIVLGRYSPQELCIVPVAH